MKHTRTYRRTARRQRARERSDAARADVKEETGRGKVTRRRHVRGDHAVDFGAQGRGARSGSPSFRAIIGAQALCYFAKTRVWYSAVLTLSLERERLRLDLDTPDLQARFSRDSSSTRRFLSSGLKLGFNSLETHLEVENDRERPFLDDSESVLEMRFERFGASRCEL